jgi:hypothetical protein
MALDDMVQIREDFRLLDIMLLPLVLLEIFLVPGEAVDVGLSIRHGARVPIPVDLSIGDVVQRGKKGGDFLPVPCPLSMIRGFRECIRSRIQLTPTSPAASITRQSRPKSRSLFS